jgi:hypothetical protein
MKYLWKPENRPIAFYKINQLLKKKNQETLWHSLLQKKHESLFKFIQIAIYNKDAESGQSCQIYYTKLYHIHEIEENLQ